MRIDKSRISGLQFMFAMTCFIQASTLLSTFVASVTFQDSWLAALSGSLVCLPLIWLYRSLMVMFPHQNLLEIFDEVYGPVLGKVVSAGYCWFFITLGSINLTDLGDFVKLTIMEETPNVVLLIMCILVAAMALRGGISLVVRYSDFFVTVAFSVLVISIILLLNQIKLENFLPVFDQPIEKYIQGTHIIAAIPYGELVIFLMIHPNAKMSRRDSGRYLLWAFFLGGLTMLFIVLRDVSVLGNTLDMFTMPSLVTLRLVNLGMALSRVEILFVIVLIILLFFKIMVLYYVSVMTVAHLLKIKKYRHLILAVGAFMITYGLTLYPCPIRHAASAQETTPFIWSPFEILIPVLTFIVAKIRKLPAGKEM
ncbi:MAG: endospore germination permease [Clostridiales bacterium]